MMHNTPRTFVGTVMFRLEDVAAVGAGGAGGAVGAVGPTDGFDLMPEVRVSEVDLSSGTVLVTALRPIDRNDVAAALARRGIRVCQ